MNKYQTITKGNNMKIKIKTYEAKRSSLDEDEKYSNTSKFLFQVYVGDKKGKTFLLTSSDYDEIPSFICLNPEDKFNGNLGLSDHLGFCGTGSSSYYLNYFFGKAKEGVSIFSMADLLEIPKKDIPANTYDEFRISPSAFMEVDIPVNTHGFHLHHDIEPEQIKFLNKANFNILDTSKLVLTKLESVITLNETGIFREPDYYPPSDLLPNSKELREFSEYFANPANDSSDETEISEWLDSKFMPRVEKMGGVYIVETDKNTLLAKSNGEQISLGDLFR